MEITHSRENKKVASTFNHEELTIELNFDQDSQERAVSVTRWEWKRKSAAILKAILEGGLTGGTGVFVGVLHRIEITENGQTETLLDGYLDLTTADFFDYCQTEPVALTIKCISKRRPF